MQKGQKHTYPFRSVNNQLFSSSNKITCEYLHTCGVCTCKWVRLGASVLTIRHPMLGHPYMQNLMGTLRTRARRAPSSCCKPLMPKGDIWPGDAAKPGTTVGACWQAAASWLCLGAWTHLLAVCKWTGYKQYPALCHSWLHANSYNYLLVNSNLYMYLTHGTFTHSISTKPPEHSLEEPPPTTAPALLSPS